MKKLLKQKSILLYILLSVVSTIIYFVQLVNWIPNLPSVEFLNKEDRKKFLEVILHSRPILNNLSHMKNFKYYRAELTKPCGMSKNQICLAKKFCEINCQCDKSLLPTKWLQEDQELQSFSKNTQFYQEFLPEIKVKTDDFSSWSQEQFLSQEIQYVDLTLDKEEFTDYQGQEVWNYLYNIHCENSYKICKDNKFLYKIISGIHMSVSSHLSFFYKKTPESPTIPNKQMYKQKFDNKTERFKNLLFVNRIMTLAFAQFYSNMKELPSITGDFSEDQRSLNLLKELAEQIFKLKEVQFDSKLFFGNLYDHEQQRKIFIQYFREILDALNCVDCKKCRLYGKMQFEGLSVALRILLQQADKISWNEFIAFINAFNKWSQSVEIQQFFYNQDEQISSFILTLLVLFQGLLFFAIFQQKKEEEEINEQKKNE